MGASGAKFQLIVQGAIINTFLEFNRPFFQSSLVKYQKIRVEGVVILYIVYATELAVRMSICVF